MEHGRHSQKCEVGIRTREDARAYIDFFDVGAGRPARAGILRGFSQLRRPQPAVFMRVLHQASPYWIFTNVLHFCLDALFAAQHVVERFMLPNLTSSSQRAIDPVR